MKFLRLIYYLFNKRHAHIIQLTALTDNISQELKEGNFKSLKANIKIKHIPRHSELLYIDGNPIYYRVINVIHSISKKHNIWIIVEPFNG